MDTQRGYWHAIEEFVEWYCSEPRLSFSKTVVLRYRIHPESRHLAPGLFRNAASVRLLGGSRAIRTRSVLPPFSYHDGTHLGDRAGRGAPLELRADFAVVISQCRFGSLYESATNRQLGFLPGGSRFAIEKRRTADAATPAKYKNGGGHQIIWKNLGGPVA